MSDDTYFQTVALPFVLQREGGRVDDAADPGGRTNLGITQKTWDAWRTNNAPDAPGDVWDATVEDVTPLYHMAYWLAAGCDRLADGDSLAVFDCAVNMGVHRATALWQNSGADVGSFLEARRAYYRTLATEHPQLAKFLAGWLKRVDLVEEAIT
jgi:lysozyme family protein